MTYSQTTLDETRTTNEKIVFDYQVWEFIKSTKISVPRPAYNKLLNLTAKRMISNHGVVGSIRQFAQWAVGGCPCNLATELGFSDANQIYVTFRYWDTIEAIERNGHCIRTIDGSCNSASFKREASISTRKRRHMYYKVA